MILVHAGNRIDEKGRPHPRFPSERIYAVSERLSETLGLSRPRIVVSAAAAGADLLMLEAAQAHGISTLVALPLPVDEFRTQSVADQGDEWVVRYDQVLAYTDRLVTTDLSGHDDWYLVGNGFILDAAADVAELGEPIAAVVVTPTDDTTSVSHDFATKAETRGWPVTIIPPNV